MSLKRYTIIAAVSYHNSQQQQQHSSKTTTKSPSPIQTHRQKQLLRAMPTVLEDITTIKPLKSMSINVTTTTITTTTTTATNWLTLNTMQSNNNATNTGVTNGNGSGGSGSGSVASNAITTYYSGGLGLFHQQNLRANGVGGSFLNVNGNSGSASGSGVSYPNTINGNVNLLLGGAMLSLVTTILCVVCYCCHRNIKKRTEAAYRQQRQWLENDPNMEIYSVEQCYETSGIFLGESTDGLSTIPALHHEPPPSYDAVVAMQEQLLQQQQQQQLQQQLQQQSRTSPPPGYRSTLDVSAIQTAFAVAVAAAGSSRGTLNGSATNDSNGNLSSGGITGRNNIYQQQKPQQLMSPNPLLNMKKVLQAQSCCSLQRAEVENMWNAAAAAVAARNTTTNAHTTRAIEQQQNSNIVTTPTAAMLMKTRKSLPTYTFGLHYRQQKSYYRRGCPLCGKFRYDADDALSLSTESGLDDDAVTTAAIQNRARHYQEVQEEDIGLEGAHALDSSNNNNEVFVVDNNKLARTSTQNRNSNNNNKNDDIDDDDDYIDIDECLCDNSLTAATFNNKHNQQMATTSFVATSSLEQQPLQQNDYLNSNELSLGNQFVAERNESSSMVDDNANMTASFESHQSTNNSNNQLNTSTASTVLTANAESIDLNSINENGIVRLDMSKIIDKTGLPTYEAALKLESSGYV